MNVRLSKIQNFPELTVQANWSVAALAELCGVSVRTLERHFWEACGKKPKAWLAEQRQRQALELIKDGSSVKETAAQLGYKHSTHLSRAFKRYWGDCPTRLNEKTNDTGQMARFGH
jgi:transcriptional regulator GlxA family with amidase domain